MAHGRTRTVYMGTRGREKEMTINEWIAFIWLVLALAGVIAARAKKR